MKNSEPHWLHNFIVKGLYKKIIKDIYDYKIFNEADLQSKVYYHLYNRIKKEKKDNLLILNKPTIYSKKGDTKYPDLVICKTYTFKSPEPIVAIELKLNLQKFPDFQKDIEKLKTIKKDYYSTIRKGYFFFVYDDDEIWEHTREDNWMKHYFYDTSINVKKHTDSGYIRTGYEDWKQSFETVSFGR